jgi:beta-barrel assembly-enhancing protease
MRITRARRTSAPLLAALLCTSSAVGCARGIAPPAMTREDLSTEQSSRAAALITDRIELSGALREIEFAITTAAAVFCRSIERPRLGAILGSQESFAGDIAQAAARASGLDDRVSVVYLVAGGPFHAAGIQVGDAITKIDGRQVASRAELLAAVEVTRGDTTLTIERAGEELDVRVRPEMACPVSLGYTQSAQILPAPIGRTSASVPRGMLKLFSSPDDRAVLIGHQLAHLIFERPADDEVTREIRADRIGLYLSARAGYDVSGAVRVWETLVGEHPWLVSPQNADRFRSYPHQGLALRIGEMRSTLSQIAAAIQERRELIPPSD